LPDKFFNPLREAGANLVVARKFRDHHAYTDRELDALSLEARDRNAVLVTTPKDAVRLPPAFRSQVTVVGVGLRWQQPAQIERFLAGVVGSFP
jgi:tetraacyldisaccharide 4'-kinase